MEQYNEGHNPKRVAKNSIMLTIRLIITMCISLYTSRVVLNTIGVEDYGVYNVVGGLVGVFSSLTDSLSRAFSRYITFAIAKGDVYEQKKVFSANINILFLVSLLILFLCELIGIWYFSEVVNVPDDRKSIVPIVFQLSLLSFMLTLVRVPYISLIIAHERSGAYALFGIIDALMKLAIVYLLSFSEIEKLIFYCLLLAGVNFLSLIYTSLYCWHSFEGCHYIRKIPSKLYKEMIGFASWSFVGISARVFNAQGIILIINKFCGVVVNAALGIVTQVEASTRQFVSSIAVAVNPQIVKSYATGDIKYMRSLVVFSTKCFAFVVLLYAIPISLEAEFILEMWLGVVPAHTANLLRLLFCSTIFIVMASPLEVVAQASGNIKQFQLRTSVILIIALPMAWLLLYRDNNVYLVYLALIIIYFIILLVQFVRVKNIIQLSFGGYMLNIVSRVFVTALLSTAIMYFVSLYIESSLWYLGLICLLSLVTTTFIGFSIGFTKKERNMLISLIKLHKK